VSHSNPVIESSIEQGLMLRAGAIVLSDILPIEIRATYQSINNLAYGAGAA
jgi:hypothetical protein